MQGRFSQGCLLTRMAIFSHHTLCAVHISTRTCICIYIYICIYSSQYKYAYTYTHVAVPYHIACYIPTQGPPLLSTPSSAEPIISLSILLKILWIPSRMRELTSDSGPVDSQLTQKRPMRNPCFNIYIYIYMYKDRERDV